MIIVDSALKARQTLGRPLRVGMIGAGAMGWGIANQIINFMPGIELVAVFSRTLKSARRTYSEAGILETVEVKTKAQLEKAIIAGQPAVTEDYTLLCQANGIDIIAEVTGTIEFAAEAILFAIRNHKNVVMMNAEVDATIGPILKVYADREGVILSGCEGDQPGVELNLYRFVQTLGMRPLVCGNVKGMLDPYRTPTTQAEFAKQWDQTPHMVTSFADGTKIAFEQAIVANATGMGVAQRGMTGYSHIKHVDELTEVYDADTLLRMGGIVDYVVGAEPGPGVYVIAYSEDRLQQHYLKYLKRGSGPLYSFYTPYHLCCLEVPISLARVGLLGDTVIAPQAGPVVDVITTAKRPLKAGEVLDGVGFYMTYGQCENSNIVQAERLLPIGLSEGAQLKRDIAKDEVISYDDVIMPPRRLCDQLRQEQDRTFNETNHLVNI